MISNQPWDAENDAPMVAPVCEHYWAWIKPADTNRSARICQFCHQPDPSWLSHTVEVDLGHGPGCRDCTDLAKYAEKGQDDDA